MPAGQPLIGEVWTMNAAASDSPGGIRAVRGVVADVVTNVVTLVSMTGNRLRVAPDRFLSTWQYVSPPPTSTRGCSAAGCRRAAVFEIRRDTLPEHVCPRHMPTGLAGSLIQDTRHTLANLADAAQEAREHAAAQVVPTCPICMRDFLVEHVSPSRITGGGRFFHCEGCNSRMVYTDCTNLDLRTYIRNLQNSLDLERTPILDIHTSFAVYAEIMRSLNTWLEMTGPGQITTLFGIPIRGSSSVPENGAFFLTRNSLPSAIPPTLPEFRPPPGVNTRWVNQSGTLVNVERVTSAAVHFRATGSESNAVMTLEDFQKLHRPFEARTTEKPVFRDVNPGEEWECASGVYSEAIRIIEVNERLQTIIVENMLGERRSLRRVELNDNRWRRVTRQTVYDRLNRSEDDF